MNILRNKQIFKESIEIDGAVELKQYSEAEIRALSVPDGVTALVTDTDGNLWQVSASGKSKLSVSTASEALQAEVSGLKSSLNILQLSVAEQQNAINAIGARLNNWDGSGEIIFSGPLYGGQTAHMENFADYGFFVCSVCSDGARYNVVLTRNGGTAAGSGCTFPYTQDQPDSIHVVEINVVQNQNAASAVVSVPRIGFMKNNGGSLVFTSRNYGAEGDLHRAYYLENIRGIKALATEVNE